MSEDMLVYDDVTDTPSLDEYEGVMNELCSRLHEVMWVVVRGGYHFERNAILEALKELEDE